MESATENSLMGVNFDEYLQRISHERKFRKMRKMRERTWKYVFNIYS